MTASFKSAREFFVARQNTQSNKHNKVVGKRVNVIFQTAPGMSELTKWGIKNLKYKVYWGGKEKQSGITSDERDGKVSVLVCPNVGVKTELEILGSKYEICKIENLAPSKTIRGYQQRLCLLGYYSGSLQLNENSITQNKELYDIPNVETEKAVLDFQADHNLFADALCGPRTLEAIEKALKEQEEQVVTTTGAASDYDTRKSSIGSQNKMKRLVHKYQRICPVRFARAPHATNPNATSGGPDANAPDPDDRGFKNCLSTSYGAVVLPIGFDPDMGTQAQTRIKLIRENIADDSPLYICSSNTSMLTVSSPSKVANGHGAIFHCTALKHGKCFLEVHYDSEKGPVLHRMQVVITSLKTIDVKAHAPIINSTIQLPSVGAQSIFNTKAKIESRFADVNKIYFPYGIKFDVMNSVDTDTHNFLIQGAIDLGTAEGATMSAHNRAGNGAINVIFVPQIVVTQAGLNPGENRRWLIPQNSIGGAASSAVTNPNAFTVYLADWAGEAQTIAHEIGHVLNLVNDPSDPRFVHSNTRDSRTGPQVPGTGVRVRDDIVSRRRLMWAFTSISAQSLRTFPAIAPTAPGTNPVPPAYNFENIMSYRENVGYGATKVGTMLAIKNFKQDPSDLEMREVQKTADILIGRAGQP